MGSKHGRRRHHQRISSNPLAMVISQVACMSEEQQVGMTKRFRTAFAALASGCGDLSAWSTMADMCNLAEALAELRIGSNLTTEIQQGQAALGALMGRVHAGAGWTIDGPEISALGECLVVYRAQIQLCSTGEHRRAEELVRRRVDAAIKADRIGRVGPHVVHARPPDPPPQQESLPT